MNLLIDTHTIIWYSENNPNISEKSKSLISDINNNCYISIATIWEMAIKIGINKLNLDLTLDDFINELRVRGFNFLPINLDHILQTTKLDLFHKDPFDRIIISQAIVENMNIISKDENFDGYLIQQQIQRIW